MEEVKKKRGRPKKQLVKASDINLTKAAVDDFTKSIRKVLSDWKDVKDSVDTFVASLAVLGVDITKIRDGLMKGLNTEHEQAKKILYAYKILTQSDKELLN